MAAARKTQDPPTRKAQVPEKKPPPPSLPPTSLPHFRLTIPDSQANLVKEPLFTDQERGRNEAGALSKRYAEADTKRAETGSDELEPWEHEEFRKHEKFIPEMTKSTPWGDAIFKSEDLSSTQTPPMDLEFQGGEMKAGGGQATIEYAEPELDPAKWRTTAAVSDWMLRRKNWKLQARYGTLDPSGWDQSAALFRDANRVVGVGLETAAQGAVDFLVGGSNLLKEIAEPAAKSADFFTGMVPQSTLDYLEERVPHKDMGALTWAVGKAIADGKITPDEFFEARNQNYQEKMERNAAWEESQEILDEDRLGLRMSLSLSRGLGFAAQMFYGPMAGVARVGEKLLGKIGAQWTAEHMAKLAMKSGLPKDVTARLAKNGDLFRVVTREMLEHDKYRTALTLVYNRALPRWARNGRTLIDDRSMIGKVTELGKGTYGELAGKSLAWGTSGFIGGHEGHRMQEALTMALMIPTFVIGGRLVNQFGEKFLKGSGARLPVEAALEGTAFTMVDYETWGDLIEAYGKGDLGGMADAGVEILGTAGGFAALRMMTNVPRGTRPPSGDYNRAKPPTEPFRLESKARAEAEAFHKTPAIVEKALVPEQAKAAWVEQNGLVESPKAEDLHRLYGEVDPDLSIAMLKEAGLLHPPEGDQDPTFDPARHEIMESLGLRDELSQDILDSVVASGWQPTMHGDTVTGSLPGTGDFTLSTSPKGFQFTPAPALARDLGIEQRSYAGAEALAMMDVLSRATTLSSLQVKNRFLPPESGWLPTDNPTVYMHPEYGIYTERFGHPMLKPPGGEWGPTTEVPEAREPGPAAGEMDALVMHLTGLIAEQRATGGVIEDAVRFDTAVQAVNMLSRPGELPEEVQMIFTDPVWPELLENAGDSDPAGLIDMLGRVLANEQPASSGLEEFMSADQARMDVEAEPAETLVGETEPTEIAPESKGVEEVTDLAELEKAEEGWSPEKGLIPPAPPKPPADVPPSGGEGEGKGPPGDEGDIHKLGEKLAHPYPGIMSSIRRLFTAESKTPIEAGGRYLLEQMQGKERLADNVAMRFMRDATELFGEKYLNDPATGGDLIAAIEMTGNPHYDKGEQLDAYDMVRARIASQVSPSAYESMKTSISRLASGRRAVDVEGGKHIKPQEMSPLEWIDDVVRPLHDKLFEEALERGDFAEDAYREQYLAHRWKVKSRKLSGSSKYEMGALGMKSPHAKKRTIDTYAEGVRRGLIPKTFNVAEIVGGYIKVQGRVAAHQELREALKAFELPTSEPWLHGDQPMRVMMPTSAKRAQGSGYLEVDHPAFKGFSIHPEMEMVLRRALTANPLDESTFFNVMFGLNSLMKAFELTGSFFHPGALVPESGTFTGKGIGKPFKKKSLAGKALSLTPVTGFQAFLQGRKAMLEQPRVDRAIMAGVIGVGQGGRGTSDLHNELKFQFIDAVGKSLAKIPLAGGAIKKSTADVLREAMKVNDAIVWEFAHQYTKIALFESVADSLAAKFPGEDMRIVEKQAAQFVNHALGGLNTQAWFRVSKPTIKVLQAIPLSLDWTMANLAMAVRGPIGFGISTIRAGFELPKAQVTEGAGEMIRPDEHLPEWMRGLGGTSKEAFAYWARAMIYMTAMVDMMQWTWLQTTLDDDEKEEWLAKSGTFHIWPMPWEWGEGATGNPPGKRFGYMGLGVDEKSRQEFARHGKQIQETIEMAGDPGRTATRKLGPGVQMSADMIGMMKAQGGPEFWSAEMGAQLLGSFAERFVPFSFRGTGLFMHAYPVSKGVTNSYLRNALGAELSDWAEGVGNLDTISSLLEDARKQNRYGTEQLKAEIRETRQPHYDALKEFFYDYDESAIERVATATVDRLVALGTTRAMAKTVLKTWKKKAVGATRPLPKYADDAYLLQVERMFPEAMSPNETPRGYALEQLLRSWRGADEDVETELRERATGESRKK